MRELETMHPCRYCGAPIAADQRFCGRCGSFLDYLHLQEQHSDAITQITQPSVLEDDRIDIRNTTDATAAGTLLGGRYRIVRLAGKGGFGAIYEAQDTRFQPNRTVAVKEMSAAHLDADEKARFIPSVRLEADLLSQLKHPLIPDVMDFFDENGNAYLVMEFIRGITLERELQYTKGSLDERLVLVWAVQLCDVLNYLHTRPQPIIFRDLKPTNIMVTAEKRIKLIDFGIARIFKVEATSDTKTLGSRNYAAPEQYGLGQSDPRTDIYGLGATLYMLLTGTAPTESLVRQANLWPFRTPRELNPRISAITERIVLKAMALDPKDRFQSASEMYYAIRSSGLISITTGGLYPTSTRMLDSLSKPQIPPVSGVSGILPQPNPTPQLLTPVPGTSGGMTLPNPYGGTLPANGPSGPFVPTPIPNPSLPPPPPPPGPKDISRRRLLAGGIGAAAVLALGGTALGYILLSKGPEAAANAISISFTCSTEKVDWMQASVEAFHNSGATLGGKTIQIELDLRGSVDAQQKILNGTIQPIIWSPASLLELNQLNAAWQQAHAGKDIIITSGNLQPKELVFSPLVFAVWQERAQILLKHYTSIDWPSIHNALTQKSWSDIGGNDNWGQVKFGHTRPDQSNSGLLTITLLAYSFFQEQRGLTIPQVDDPGFLKYFNDIEGAVTGFGKSSGTFITNVVIPMGPPAFDIVATYENLVLTKQKLAQQAQHQALQLFYPSLNIVSDHPFAILQGSWVTREQQMAAQIFRDFLLSPQQQRLALTTGFRPANLAVQITDNVPGNKFLQQSSNNITIHSQIQPLAQFPNADVINELIKLWKARYNGAYTEPG